jgi:hypothetical protein
MSGLPSDAVENVLSFLRPRHAWRAAAICRQWSGLYRCADLRRTESVAALTVAVPFLRALRLSASIAPSGRGRSNKIILRRWAATQTWPALSHLTLDLNHVVNPRRPSLVEQSPQKKPRFYCNARVLGD